METLIGIQYWLYSSIGEGLGNVANGDDWAVMAAMAAAILFGAVHALMPGHGKIVPISYHLAQPSSPTAAFTNGAYACRTGSGARPGRVRGHQQGVRLRRQNSSMSERRAYHRYRGLPALGLAFASP